MKRSESPSDGLRRIVSEQIRAALAATKEGDGAAGAAVHEFRKRLKKSRAALRLAVGALSKDRHQRDDRALRRIAKLAGDLRDAHVRLQIVTQLRKQFASAEFSDVFQRIEDLLALELASFAEACADWGATAAKQLRAAERRISSAPLDRLTWKQVCSGVAAVYRRGRDQLDRTLRRPTVKNFHDWRRETKNLWYQLRLLQPLNRTVLEEIAREAGTLSDLLGRHHDFAFLVSRLDLERDDESLQNARAKLTKLIKKRIKRLERDASELGRHFYAEAPKAFAKRISIFMKERTGLAK